MTRLALAAALVAAFGVCLTVIPARTSPHSNVTWQESQPQTVQSAGVHDLIGASFHAVHASF